MDTVIGMVLAFLLGAYVREPFALKEKKEVKEQDNELLDMMREEQKEEQRRQLQIYKALQWNGKKGKLNEED